METEDVLGYLVSKGLNPKRASPTEVHVLCPFHGEEPGSRGRLYVNVDPNAEIPGLYFCHVCGRKGALGSLRKHFGDPPLRPADDRPFRQNKVLQAAAGYYESLLTSEAMTYLTGPNRGLRPETIKEHRLGWADGGLHTYLRGKGFHLDDMKATGLVTTGASGVRDFLRDEITIPYIASGQVVMIRGKRMDGKYRTPPGQKARLFNTDTIWGADEGATIYVTEGEFDCLILEQLGYDAVGAPGTSSWQEGWNDYFDHAKRINIVFDVDVRGKEGATKLRDALGAKARVVELPLDGVILTDVTDYIVVEGHTRQDFEGVVRAALGGLLLSVADARAEWEATIDQVGVKFGFEYLDDLVSPGLLGGQICVPLAKTGTGKTILLLNMFQRMALLQPELQFLFVSLEQTRSEWFERAVRINAFYRRDLGPISRDPAALEQFKRLMVEETDLWWQDRIMLTDKNRVTDQELRDTLDDYKLHMGRYPDVLMIDYLGYWANSFKARDRYEKVSDAIMALKAIGKDYRVPIICPHQVNRMVEFGAELDVDSARDSGVIEETADFAFTLWNDDAQKGRGDGERSGVTTMKIGKSRHGGRGRKMDFQFGYSSLVLVERPYDDGERPYLPPSTRCPRCSRDGGAKCTCSVDARREVEYDNRNEGWALACFRHRTGDPHAGNTTEAVHKRQPNPTYEQGKMR